MTSATLNIDPRIRARRVAVLRAQGRRRLRILLVLGFALLAAAAGWGVSLTPVMDVDRIAIAGVDSSRADEILRTSQMEAGMPMLFADVEQAASSIAALPWIKSARVRRDWPATLRIDVVPRVPVAVVPTEDGRTALIDASAYVIGWLPSSEGGAARAGLLELSVPFDGGLGGIHTDADGPLAVVAAMPADLRPWVGAVTLDPSDGDVGLELLGGAAVMLGEPILLDNKLSAVRAVLAGADLDCITEMDVTMPDIATVTRHRPCPPQLF